MYPAIYGGLSREPLNKPEGMADSDYALARNIASAICDRMTIGIRLDNVDGLAERVASLIEINMEARRVKLAIEALQAKKQAKKAAAAKKRKAAKR